MEDYVKMTDCILSYLKIYVNNIIVRKGVNIGYYEWYYSCFKVFLLLLQKLGIWYWWWLEVSNNSWWIMDWIRFSSVSACDFVMNIL